MEIILYVKICRHLTEFSLLGELSLQIICTVKDLQTMYKGTVCWLSISNTHFTCIYIFFPTIYYISKPHYFSVISHRLACNVSLHFLFYQDCVLYAYGSDCLHHAVVYPSEQHVSCLQLLLVLWLVLYLWHINECKTIIVTICHGCTEIDIELHYPSAPAHHMSLWSHTFVLCYS